MTNLSVVWSRLSRRDQDNLVKYIEIYIGTAIRRESLILMSRAAAICVVKERRHRHSSMRGPFARSVVRYCDRLLEKLLDEEQP